MRSHMCKQKFLLLKQNEDTDAEKISNLAEPTETPCAKLVPEPRCARPRHRHFATRPQSNSQEPGSQDLKRTVRESFTQTWRKVQGQDRNKSERVQQDHRTHRPLEREAGCHDSGAWREPIRNQVLNLDSDSDQVSPQQKSSYDSATKAGARDRDRPCHRAAAVSASGFFGCVFLLFVLHWHILD